MAAELIVIRWRDIPVQVVVQGPARARARVQLSDRFQEAVDEAALRAGLLGTDEYLGEWRRDTRPCGDDLDAEARAEAERLESAYDADRLTNLARLGGGEGDRAPDIDVARGDS
jgi:Virulence factor